MTKILNRDELVEDYVTRIIDEMDTGALGQWVFDKMRETIEEYTDEQLLTEIQDYYPDLLEEHNHA